MRLALCLLIMKMVLPWARAPYMRGCQTLSSRFRSMAMLFDSDDGALGFACSKHGHVDKFSSEVFDCCPFIIITCQICVHHAQHHANTAIIITAKSIIIWKKMLTIRHFLSDHVLMSAQQLFFVDESLISMPHRLGRVGHTTTCLLMRANRGVSHLKAILQ